MTTADLRPAVHDQPTVSLTIRDSALVFAGALLLFAVWAVVVPVLEGPDEAYFYTEALRAARGEPIIGSSLMPFMAEPILRPFGAAPPFAPRLNPSFRFVSNRHGHVNRYLADWLPGAHVRRLLALRAMTALLCAATVTAIYAAACLFFGRRDLGLLVAALAAATPQFSFMSAILNTEGASTLAGAAMVALLVARATDALSPWATFTALLPVLVMAPFSDRQAYPLLALTPIAAVLIARRRATQVAGAIALAAGGLLIYLVAPAYLHDRVPPLVPWLDAMEHPLRPFTTRPGVIQYYVAEITPKLFEGFWGWLGQPSILLPSWIYAIAGVWTATACAGLCLLPAAGTLRDPRRARATLVLLVATTLVTTAVFYAPVVLGPNLYYGRWFFPVIGPLFIAGVLGVATIARLVPVRPRLVAGTCLGLALALGLAWIAPPGAWLRATIVAHHYGDQPRLLAAMNEFVALLVLVCAIVAACCHDGVRHALPRLPAARIVCAVAGVAVAANLVLLFGYVRPLYASMSPGDFHDGIEYETAHLEFNRATALAAAALDRFPDSPQLRADFERASFRTGPYESIGDALAQHVGSGPALTTAADVLQAARLVRATGWTDSNAWRRAMRAAAGNQDLGGPLALLDAELSRSAADPALAGRVLIGAHSLVTTGRVRHLLEVEGYRLDRAADGHCELTAFFRPRGPMRGVRLWMRMYAPQIPEYLDFDANPQAYEGWVAGELAWEFFQLPFDSGSVFLGAATGVDAGPALGPVRIANCAPVR